MAVEAIFGHQGVQKPKNLDYLQETGAAAMAHNIPSQFRTTLFPGGMVPEEPKTC